jgi:hypothetical protein
MKDPRRASVWNFHACTILGGHPFTFSACRILVWHSFGNFLHAGFWEGILLEMPCVHNPEMASFWKSPACRILGGHLFVQLWEF